MYQIDNHFGVQVFADTIGEVWINLVEAVLTEGVTCSDEGRKRIALDNVRIKAIKQSSTDPIIKNFGDQNNLEAMLSLTFKEPIMYDVDVTPSFSKGAKSYFQRIQEGRFFDFVIHRLSTFPESKKAVLVFPTCYDYRQVLANMNDDYLPCLVSVQFRLSERGSGYVLNATCNFRSMDVYQKGHGNMAAIAKMTELLSKRIGHKFGKKVHAGFLDGLIVDAHIYEDTLEEARKTVGSYKRSE